MAVKLISDNTTVPSACPKLILSVEFGLMFLTRPSCYHSCTVHIHIHAIFNVVILVNYTAILLSRNELIRLVFLILQEEHTHTPTCAWSVSCLHVAV